MKQKRKKYTKEFKEEAVKMVTEQGYRISEVARDLGINENMLGRWKQEQLRENENGDSEGNGKVEMESDPTFLVKCSNQP